MSHYTQGDWSFVETAMANTFPSTFANIYVGPGEGHHHVARINGRRAEAVQNARLVSAAPDMYEALKACQVELAKRLLCEDLFEMVNLAIAKANGVSR